MVNSLKESLLELAKKDRLIVVLSIDDYEIYNAFSVLGNRYICAGISECNMVAVAAGMASCGYKPFVIGGGTFLTFRAAEFIRNEVCLQKQKVNFIGIGAGLAISVLGSTHHCTEDIGVLKSIPRMDIITPATPTEVKKAIECTLEDIRPVYLRIGRASGDDFYINGSHLQFAVGKIQIIRNGNDAILLSMGSIVCEVLYVAEELAIKNVNCTVVNVHTVCPLDIDGLKALSSKCKKWIVIEEHNISCGLSNSIADAIVLHNISGVKMYRMGLIECFSQGHGTYDDIKSKNHLGKHDIIKYCEMIVNDQHYQI